MVGLWSLDLSLHVALFHVYFFHLFYNTFNGIIRVSVCVCVCMCVCMLGHVQFFVSPWTVARETLSMEFSRQEHWSGLAFPPPGDICDPAIEPAYPILACGFLTSSATWEAQSKHDKECK